jgi:hypothetical protein
MARYIYMIQGCKHTFKSKQDALDYASFDRFFEFMRDTPPGITIISRYTPEQYKRMLQRQQAQEAQV